MSGVITLKFEQKRFSIEEFIKKVLMEWQKSVDPDQTAL